MEDTFFRHTLVTISHRAGVTFKDIPEHYPDFQAGEGVRTPVEILSHMSDVLTLAYSWFAEIERNREVQEWDKEVDRFYTIIEKLDKAFVDKLPINTTYEKLIQGPLADVLTHIGQLLTLRRLVGSPTQGESYIKADIQVGKINRV